ncbi:MAG TPA: alpha-E domain-containing protein [Roseiflexaceae bacterium]|nr:alpha-E domain-containing protein [Roseiflexaceae bacterium]
MLSRVADSLYWMSRYLERAEHTARMLDVCLHQLDHGRSGTSARWERLLTSLHSRAPEDRHEPYVIVEALTFDTTREESVAAAIAAARENARQVREQISSEMWEQINRLYLHVRGANMATIWHEPHEYFQSVKEGVHLFQGITDATMSHGEGWQFIQIGRSLERAIATARLLDVHFSHFTGDGEVSPTEDQEWVGLLKSCTAYEAYCKVYTATIRPDRVAEFLLLDAHFPRSIRFAAEIMHVATRAVAATTGTRQATRVDRLAGRLRAALDYGQTDEILADMNGYLDNIRRLCLQIDQAIYQSYITYSADIVLAS